MGIDPAKNVRDSQGRLEHALAPPVVLGPPSQSHGARSLFNRSLGVPARGGGTPGGRGASSHTLAPALALNHLPNLTLHLALSLVQSCGPKTRS